MKEKLGIWCVAIATDILTEISFWRSDKNEVCLNQRLITAGCIEVAKAIAVEDELKYLNKERPKSKITLQSVIAQRIKDAE